MRAKERMVDRILTKLETMKHAGEENGTLMVLPDWMADLIDKVGFRVGRRHHCKEGLWWYWIGFQPKNLYEEHCSRCGKTIWIPYSSKRALEAARRSGGNPQVYCGSDCAKVKK
jgi:hypothetical protein